MKYAIRTVTWRFKESIELAREFTNTPSVVISSPVDLFNQCRQSHFIRDLLMHVTFISFMDTIYINRDMRNPNVFLNQRRRIPMKNLIFLFIFTFLFTMNLPADEPAVFSTQWIPSQPEISTYRSKSDHGEGLYQVTIMKRDSLIEVYINIISTGFTKTVSGTMTLDMNPLQSTSKIFIDKQILMNTSCTYKGSRVCVTTDMLPYKKRTSDTFKFTRQLLDFSQAPLLPRTLQLEKGGRYTFTSLSPRTNTFVPLTIQVIGKDRFRNMDCYKVEMNDFEGRSIYWIENNSRHRVLKIEQPESHGISELLE